MLIGCVILTLHRASDTASADAASAVSDPTTPIRERERGQHALRRRGSAWYDAWTLHSVL
eukprot:3940822-Rhodomonas_salina.1